MNTFFDDLTREVAKATSRRDILKSLGRGLAGLLLASLGARKASAAVSCGTCQACNLDAGTCGLPCNPASAGQALCTTASTDGSYLRLASYLTTKGFVAAGVSDSVLLFRSGSLFQSALTTNFQNPGVSGETAILAYTLSPQGGVASFAVVVQSGAPIYALSVDSNGSIVQTIATQTQSAPSADLALAQSAGGSAPQQPTALAPRTAAASVPELIPGVSPEVCDYIFGILCGVVVLGYACYAIGAALCVAEVLATFGLGAAAIAPCGIAVTLICGLADFAACTALQGPICDCAFNTQYCEGVCCGPCQDCSPSGACVPANNVAACPSKVCCNGQCCAEGLVCDPNSNACASPNTGCLGATCASYSSCNGNSECFCGTIEGGTLCQVSTACAPLALCPDGFCALGSVCLYGSCCGEPVCVPLSVTCPSGPSSSALSNKQAISGPTTGGYR